MIGVSNKPKPERTRTSEKRAEKIKAIIKEIDKALSQEQLQLAEDLIHKLRKIDTSPETAIRLAHLMFIEQKYVQAEQLYKELLPIISEKLKPEVFFGLGQIYFESKMFSDCHLAFSLISNSYPKFQYIDLIHLKLAKIMIKFESYGNAITYLNKIIENNEAGKNLYTEALIVMSVVKGKQGDKTESYEFCKKGFNINKSFRTVSCAALMLLERDPARSEDICKKILSKDRNPGEFSDFFCLRAMANMKLKKFEMAKIMLEEQVIAFPCNYLYLETLGIVYLKLENKVKALEIFQRVRNLFPNDTCNLKNLAYTYKLCGYKEEAWHTLVAGNLVDENGIILGKLEITEPQIDALTFPTNQV